MHPGRLGASTPIPGNLISTGLLTSTLLVLAACGTGRPIASDDAAAQPQEAGADVILDQDASAQDAADAPTSDASPAVGPCGEGVVYCNEAEARGLLVDGPAYGRGAAWVDVDGDGWEDLWQSDTGTGYAHHDRTSQMYRNLGGAQFEPLDLGIAAEHMRANWTGSWGDIDNDGDPDLLLVNGGYSEPNACALYRNDLADLGGFTDVSRKAGIRTPLASFWSASFADIDADSFLDVAITARNRRLYLFRNQGDGTFDEEAVERGLDLLVADAKNPVWLDYDRDDDPDLYVCTMSDHRLYRNDGPSGFADVSLGMLAQIGASPPVFAAAATDFDQDGWEDLYLGRWFAQDHILINDHGEGFVLRGQDVGLDMSLDPEDNENTMGLTVGDIDDDGWPDVIIGTGMPGAAALPIVLCNEGLPLGFHRCSEDFIAGQGASRNHGIALGDPDHDGDTDLFWNLGGHVEWDIETGGESRQDSALYIRYPDPAVRTAVVHLVGTVSNRSAIGARLEVLGSETHYYTVRGMDGFPAQSSDWLVVSLGDANEGTVTVRWPSGAVSETAVRAGQRLEIVE